MSKRSAQELWLPKTVLSRFLALFQDFSLTAGSQFLLHNTIGEEWLSPI
jgi:hypothetical protein